VLSAFSPWALYQTALDAGGELGNWKMNTALSDSQKRYQTAKSG